MKRTIAIVAGGDTSEFHVSLRSAQGIYSFIDKEKYTLYIVEMHGLDWHVQLPDGAKAPVDRNDFSFVLDGEKVTFDFAYITIHGTPGEDGRLQGYFDMLHIPYSCCGVLAASLTYDKFACNQYLKGFGVRIAESLLLRGGQSVTDEDVMEKIGLPCFIKPSLGGSSFGERADTTCHSQGICGSAGSSGGGLYGRDRDYLRLLQNKRQVRSVPHYGGGELQRVLRL